MKVDREINKKRESSGFPFLLITLAVLLAIICSLPSASSALIGIKEGDPPREILLEDLSGTIHDVTDLFGKKPVILVFWELTTDKSFLNYSLDELRFLNDFYKKYHEETGLEIFGIYTPEEEKYIPAVESAAVRNLIKVNKIKFPVLIDRGFKLFREYGVIALPSTIMVDKTGKIKFIYPSFPIAAQPLFSEQIRDLVGAAGVAHKDKGLKTKGPDSHSIRLYHYSLQLYKKGLLEQALSPLRKSLALEPDFAWVHNLMGIIMWKRGNYEDAVKELDKAIKLERDNAPAHFNYGLLLFENEKFDEAEKHFNFSIALNNSMAEAHYVLGLLYKKTGRPDDALKELKTALALFEKRKITTVIFDSSAFHRISTLYTLSELYIKNGDDKQAMDLLQKAAQVALGLESVTDKEHLYRSRDLMIYE